MSGGTEADLTVKARITELYVCRVNDHDGNSVFSDWVKVKVLDTDKTGMHCAIFMLVSDSVASVVFFSLSLLHIHNFTPMRRKFYFVSLSC